MSTVTAGGASSSGMTAAERRVIFASSLGTVFEWYDFYLYGSLSAIIAAQFFSGVAPTAAFIFALLAFAAGFAVRPFGALVFGRLGDLVGRKHTFLITILIMGLSTFLVGILPSYASIGVAAPIILISLRLLQGLALGGEYGGAATYVAEHAPEGKRGYFTSWIQTTATMGLFLSLLVILGVRTYLGEAAFKEWGWRIPFLVSVALLAVSVWIRLQLNESPAFKKMKEEGKVSKAPLTEAFGRWSNLKVVILSLLGLTSGQAVVWYTGQFYALFFLTQTLKVDSVTANILIAVSLAIGTPFFVLFGWLSDKIGRKPIIMLGCLLAALTYFPLFKALAENANPVLTRASDAAIITVVADPAECSFQFVPGELKGQVAFNSSCDLAKGFLANNYLTYQNEAAPAGTIASIKIGSTVIPSFDGRGLPADQLKASMGTFTTAAWQALQAANYPIKATETEKDGVKTTTYAVAAADPAQMNTTVVVAILFVLVLYVTMVYGPIAAMLVELFPTRIRYTSMSLPYHIGNGWFGGFLPTTAFAMVAATGNIYSGLWYPIVVASATFVIGMLFIRETKDNDIHAD
ncbi:MFS transporter [Oryzibacter oryziterrae]|uniref:MFS transporter n=1 Tax=Oryzibacter oryziterrae TaxID=2766474 RepID=UPI001F1B0951|nr:MFS transporter [Oryzibacter oryziterrae]